MQDQTRNSIVTRLTPRQRACLEGVWRLQTSKEIARELGITKTTVDEHIERAVTALGAADRRAAAIAVFGPPPIESGRDPIGADPHDDEPQTEEADREIAPWWRGFAWPVRTRWRPENDLSSIAILTWIVVIAVGSLAALSLAIAVAEGLGRLFPPQSHNHSR